MRYELIVRPEPFSWPAEVDGYGSFETKAFGQWQGETRRDDPNDIRWVQDSLNRLMNLWLPLTGVMDAAARSALRSFQEKRGLTADGVLGPGTKRALAEAATYPGEKEAFPVSRLPARARAALTQGALAKKTPFRYVKDFAGPASECAEALKRAGKTRAEALGIINAQIGVAIAMLRKSATALKHGSRSDKTKTLFQKIFKVKPEFVPTWLKPTATIKDRGDVVATRCKRVAELLASGTIKFFCTINSTNCPDCSNNPRRFACSSYGDESKAPQNSRVVCLGDLFWDDMKAGKTDSLLATIMHEPFHIYYGVYVTEHRSDAGKFGGINCIVQLVFETNGRAAPDRVHEGCTNMVVRKEVGGFLSFRPEPFVWPTESEWEAEASRTGPDYIRWVQSSLNRALGLRLAVDGIMGPATRSAVRSFQQRKGLAVDGIVGPNTEAALIAAGGPKPPVAVSASTTGPPSSTALPPECSAAASANCDVLEDFALDDDTLTAIHREQIAGIARRVISSQEASASPVKSLLIVGHASPEGPVDYNIDLALRRATEVEFALLDRLEAIKLGSTRQIILEVKSCGEAKISGVSDSAKRRVDVCFDPLKRLIRDDVKIDKIFQAARQFNETITDGRSVDELTLGLLWLSEGGAQLTVTLDPGHADFGKFMQGQIAVLIKLQASPAEMHRAWRITHIGVWGFGLDDIMKLDRGGDFRKDFDFATSEARWRRRLSEHGDWKHGVPFGAVNGSTKPASVTLIKPVDVSFSATEAVGFLVAVAARFTKQLWAVPAELAARGITLSTDRPEEIPLVEPLLAYVSYVGRAPKAAGIWEALIFLREFSGEVVLAAPTSSGTGYDLAFVIPVLNRWLGPLRDNSEFGLPNILRTLVLDSTAHIPGGFLGRDLLRDVANRSDWNPIPIETQLDPGGRGLLELLVDSWIVFARRCDIDLHGLPPGELFFQGLFPGAVSSVSPQLFPREIGRPGFWAFNYGRRFRSGTQLPLGAACARAIAAPPAVP